MLDKSRAIKRRIARKMTQRRTGINRSRFALLATFSLSLLSLLSASTLVETGATHATQPVASAERNAAQQSLQAASDLEEQQQQLQIKQQETLNSSGSTSKGAQLGDLVAIGGVTFVDPVTGQLRTVQQTGDLARATQAKQAGRLVDSIATQASGVDREQAPPNKLDYIIDFMRSNKLTKFCDLFFAPTDKRAEKEDEIEQLKRQLNSLAQFTLFVPTNEAFDSLPAHQVAQLEQSLEMRRKFLLAHAAGELIVPKLSTQTAGGGGEQRQASDLLPQRSSARWSSGRARERIMAPSSVSLAFSLAGGQLRVVTAPLVIEAQNGSTKVELIVNGASVLSGSSHALQEPNNSSATYAIVHLIDRPLYPLAQRTMLQQIDKQSAQFGKLIRLARDASLLESLEQTNVRLLTAFLPTDQALSSAPSKLFDKLETNRTFLLQFLRSHLVENVYYGRQLSSPVGAQGDARLLTSLAGIQLELESKPLTGSGASQLLLVNSVPVLEQDLLALNGVVHMLARPLPIDEACACELGAPTALSSASPGAAGPSAPLASANQDSRAANTSWFRAGSTWARAQPEQQSNGIGGGGGGGGGGGEQLERDESVPVQKRVRSQRSQSLVARNNRDFYRPSAAPDNLQLEPASSDQATEAANLRLNNEPSQSNLRGAPVAGVAQNVSDLFDAERYKVVLSAASRQQMREQQKQQQQQQQRSNLTAGSSSSNLFAYDQPLSSGQLGSPADGNKLRYQAASNNSSAAADQVSSASSEQRAWNARLLKFQAEDARDRAPPSGQQPGSRARPLASPPAYDLVAGQNSASMALESTLSARKQQQLQGKTVRPPLAGSSGAQSGLQGSLQNNCAFYDAECRRLLSGKLVRLPPTARQQRLKSVQATQSLTLSPGSQLFDSTFGETTTITPVLQAATPIGVLVTTSRKQAASGVQQQRPVAPLAQPLPPWDALDEQANRAQGWPPSAGAGELSRIRFNQQATNWSSIQALQPDAPILLVPVKMFQDASLPLVVAAQNQRSNLSTKFARPTSAVSPTYLGVSEQSQQRLQRVQSGRLATNVSAYDSFDDQQAFGGPLVGAKRVPPSSSSASLMEQLASKLQAGGGGANSNKLVRNQASNAFENHFAHAGSPSKASQGDISITTASKGASKSGALTSLASNQQPTTSARLPEVATANGRPASSSPDSAEFFQNRSVAEIMDDSGLRIDGQQVTFARLRECLERANLLALVEQSAGSSSTLAQSNAPPLTVFMPTDSAFQRLVQQQAVAQQQQQQTRGSLAGSRLSARLVDPMRRHMLPLIGRSPTTTSTTGSSVRLTRDSSLAPRTSNQEPLASDSTLALSSRLTIDCSAPQVRQLLLDHMSGQLVTPRQLQMDQAITTLSGRRLLLSSVPQKKIVVVDGQPVIAATRAKNAMVYVVNKFLNVSDQMSNVIDLMEKQPQLSTFQSYLTFSSLSDRLKRESGPITVLAPTNEAFEQLSGAARQLINSDPSALADILRGHIVEGAQFGKLISMRNRLKTMNPDQTIEAKVIKPNVYQLDNQLTSMRLIGTTGNGVVNSIDRLIVPVWLRVSMGSGAQRELGALTAHTGNQRQHSSDGRSLLNELDLATLDPNSSLTRNKPFANIGLHNNLPALNSQPVRFEPPPGNSRSFPQGNSFTLATTTSRPFSDINNNINLKEEANLGFDHAPVVFARQPASNFSSADLFRGGNTFRDQSEPPKDVINETRDNRNQTKNMQLIEKLATLMKAKKFAKYLLKSRLSEQLKPDMNYVILVPTDQAIDRLPKQIVDMLDRDQEKLADLINFHVLDTTFEYINTIPDGQTLNTLNEKDILFNWHRNNTVLTASGAVVLGGIQEENIALLIVDRVLYPTPGDLLSIVSKSPILSNLTSLLKNAKLEQQLSLAGPYTLFAPSDFAFNQLDRRDFEFLQRNKETARRFLLRHICQPAIFTSSIALSSTSSEPARASGFPSEASNRFGGPSPSLQVTNSLGEELKLRQKNDYFSVNDVNFSYADVAATNGVVHVIDGLL